MSLLMTAGLLFALDPEGVMATAPAGQQAVVVGAVAPVAAATLSVSAAQAAAPHGLTTNQQIDQWLAARTAEDRPFAEDADPWAPRDDRKVHGEVSAAIGTGDFTAYSASVSVPVGESGRIDLHYSESKNSPWAYGYGGYGYGRSPGYGRYEYGYRPGRSQSVGVHYQSDPSSRRREPGDPARPLDAYRSRMIDPAAPLTATDD